MSTPRTVSNEKGQDLLATMLVVGASEAIEIQEAQGQRELVQSDVLPSVGPIAEMEALGFTFGEAVQGDEMFRAATLPEGWRRAGSSHSMWSHILDADGYRRIAIFYKAAFYDRSAHMSIESTPATEAQSEAYTEHVAPRYGERTGYADPFWSPDAPRREGPNYVYGLKGCMGEDQARADDITFARGGVNSWADDGRRLEVEIAPDGSLVEVREFTVEASA